MHISIIFTFITIFILGISCDCSTTSDNGCLNGVEFDPTTQFACRNDLYYKEYSGCCAQGIPFDINNQMCCYDGVHDKSDATCIQWYPNEDNFNEIKPLSIPKEFIDIDIDIAFKNIEFVKTENTPFNTTANFPAEYPCTHGNAYFGCLNGFPYNWNTQFPCYDFILDFSLQGCCVGTPYSYSTQSCCYDEKTNNYIVVDYGHACYAKTY